MNNLKRWAPTVLPILVIASMAIGGAIKTWSNSDFLNAVDLNSNFSHIHTTMVGGHGPRLVDSDVSSNANIAWTKINTGARVPRIIGVISGGASISAPGAAAPPWISFAGSIPSISAYATGSWTLDLTAYPRSTGQWLAVVSPAPVAGTFPTSNTFCTATPDGSNPSTKLLVKCLNTSVTDGGTVDTAVFVQIHDKSLY